MTSGRRNRRSAKTYRKKSKDRRRRAKTRKQRGGAVDLPKGYDYTMTVAYTPKSDKLGSPDEIPRVGGVAEFLRNTEA